MGLFYALSEDLLDIECKPAGQDLIPKLAVDHRVVQHSMPVLMQDEFPGLSRLFESLHHQIRLFCSHIEVIQPVYDQRGALNIQDTFFDWFMVCFFLKLPKQQLRPEFMLRWERAPFRQKKTG